MKKSFYIAPLTVCLLGTSLPAFAAGNTTAKGGHPLSNIASNWTISADVSVMVRWISQDDTNTGSSKSSKTSMRFSPWNMMDLYARYKGDRLSAQVDIEMDDQGRSAGKSGADDNETLSFKNIWAQYDFDTFSIKFGKMAALTDTPQGPWRGKYANNGTGVSLGGTAEYCIDFIIPLGKGSKFEFELAKPGDFWYTTASDAGATSLSANDTLPGVLAAYTSMVPFKWKVFAGYETYDLIDRTYEEENDISAYMVGISVMPQIGPLSLRGTVNYATNLYMTGGAPSQQKPNSAGLGSWNWDPDAETSRLGIATAAEFKINEKVALGACIGYQMWETDDGDAGAYEDPHFGYSFNAKINISKNLYFVPYVIFDDYDTITSDGTEYDEGTVTEYGVHLVARF